MVVNKFTVLFCVNSVSFNPTDIITKNKFYTFNWFNMDTHRIYKDMSQATKKLFANIWDIMFL